MDKLKKQNILYFARTMQLGGTENVVLQLCEIFKPVVNNIIVCSCGGVNTKILEELRIKHYTIPDIESKSLKTMINVIRTLNKIVKEENITVIHTHHRMAAFYVSLLCLNRKCTFINTCHNTFTNKVFLTKFAYKHANLVACGEMVKKNLVECYSMPNEKVTVIHNAVKPFKGEIIKDDFITKLHEDGNFVVGNVGRLSEQKGMEYYIDSIPLILKENPYVKFLIIGSGEDENKLKEQVKSLNIENDCYFLGYRSDIQNIMSQLDLVVLSSLWEGLPLTPIETFSVGKTIVATAVDGTVEIVNDNENGFLVKPRSSKDLSEKVIELMKDKELKKSFEVKAKITYEKEFSFEKLSNSYKQYYESRLL